MDKRIQMTRAVEKLTWYDARAMLWILNRPTAPRSARVARKVSRLGDGPWYALLGLVMWIWGGEHGQLFVATLACGFLMELPSYILLKRGIQRQRPADAQESLSAFIQPSDKFSFPSGHTAAAFMVALLVSSFFPPWTALAFGLASAVGVSRVLLGVHYPSDIVAGACLGSVCAVVALLLI